MPSNLFATSSIFCCLVSTTAGDGIEAGGGGGGGGALAFVVEVFVIVVFEELLIGSISTDLLMPNKLHFKMLRLLLGPPTDDTEAVEAAKATAAAALAAAKLAEVVADVEELLGSCIRLSLSSDFCGEGVALLLFVAATVGSLGRAVIVTELELSCLVSLSTERLRERSSCCLFCCEVLLSFCKVEAAPAATADEEVLGTFSMLVISTS